MCVFEVAKDERCTAKLEQSYLIQPNARCAADSLSRSPNVLAAASAVEAADNSFRED